MGQTLFQRLIRGDEPVEFKYFNPARAKVGDTFSLDVLGLRGLMFNLREIWHYERKVDGKSLIFGDYVLLARPVSHEDEWVRVRFMPVSEPDSELTHNVLVLRKYDEMPFCKELDEACRCDSGELEITDDGSGDKENYWRPAIDDAGNRRLTLPFSATVSVIKDINNDGKVEQHEVEQFKLEYWDYSRITKDEAGQEFTQYLFVELDKRSKVQTMWRGEEIDPQRANVI